MIGLRQKGNLSKPNELLCTYDSQTVITFYGLHNMYIVIQVVDFISRDGPDIYIYVIHYKWPKSQIR